LRVLVIAASPSESIERLSELAAQADIVIAADGGAEVAIAHGVRPQVVMGDMDSLPHATLDTLKRQGVEIRQFPARKDETDLELALLEAVERGASDIVIVGALGGRLDHTLGNIYLLTMPTLKRRHVRMLGDGVEVFVIWDEADVSGSPGDLVSLIPLTPEVSGIETDGLEYPLRGESLLMGPGRGISNALVGDTAHVSMGQGLLLAIVTRRSAEER
jgi:thiamine pyrophosphokinase